MKTGPIHFRDGKKDILSVAKRGDVMGTCATFNEKYVCCRVQVLGSVQNCPFECSYCFLQNYLTDGSTRIIEDTSLLMKEIREKTETQPSRLFRVGTWELGDSLALGEASRQAAKLVRQCSELPNVVLELKTKSDRVDALLSLDHREKTVVSWSLNPDAVIEREEKGTARLQERLRAMEKVMDAGYLVGLHVDPMILIPRWEEAYTSLVRSLAEAVRPERVAWISLGSLRFNPEMRKKIENNYPESRLTCEEMVLGDDAKMRYVKPLRVAMYRHLFRELTDRLAGSALLYLCMERWDVWDKVLGYHPDSAAHLDYLFAKSLYERFALGPCQPERSVYEQG